MSTDAAYDIVVVGGGLVGTPLALLLAQSGWRVALVDQRTHASSASEQHSQINPLHTLGACTALSQATVELLEPHQLWEAQLADSCAIKEVHVSHSGYFGSTRLDADTEQLPALGHVVSNEAFLASMQKKLHGAGVSVLDSCEVEQLSVTQTAAKIEYRKAGQWASLNAKLVIAVDGASSRIRESAGIAVTNTDYEQFAVLGNVALSQPHNHVAYERFAAEGPLAMLPRPSQHASYVFCLSPDRFAVVDKLSDDQFAQALQSAFGFRLGRLQTVGERIGVPLLRIEAVRQVDQRLVLMGNAMRLLHPVAGQGYNLALRDVAVLHAHLKNVLSQQGDPGADDVLNVFESARRKDQQQTVQLTDLLARTFRGKASLPSHARALGLLGLDTVPALRQLFVNRSMGRLRRADII